MIDSDDGGDVFLQDSFEPSSQNKKKTVKETVSMIQYSTYYLLLYLYNYIVDNYIQLNQI